MGTGLVTSLARPGGNITGISVQATDLASKRLELLREVVSPFRRLAVVANVGFAEAMLEVSNLQALAGSLGVEVTTLEIRRAEDITAGFEALKPQADALYAVQDPLIRAAAGFGSKAAHG